MLQWFYAMQGYACVLLGALEGQGACLRNVAIPDLLQAKVLLVVLYCLVHVTCITKKECGELLNRSEHDARDLLILLSCCTGLGSVLKHALCGDSLVVTDTSTAKDSAVTSHM